MQKKASEGQTEGHLLDASGLCLLPVNTVIERSKYHQHKCNY